MPSLDTKAFLKLLQLDLTANPPPAPVVHIWMGVNPVKPQAAQIRPVRPGRARAGEAGADAGAHQSDRRGGPRRHARNCCDTHRPGAFRMVARAVERPAAAATARSASSGPPRAARVTLDFGRSPAYVAADGIRGKVIDLAGPWRTSGDWWTADPWARDEWDIALSDGALYRIYCDPPRLVPGRQL